MPPHEYHEFQLFAEGSVIPPEHRLMLVNFHRGCIGDAKEAQWDRAIHNELASKLVKGINMYGFHFLQFIPHLK